jgi:hypothetical protein
MARIRVVLPAPLGPSSPLTPGPNEHVSSDSATFGPNHTDSAFDLDGGVGGQRRVGVRVGVGDAHRSTHR